MGKQYVKDQRQNRLMHEKGEKQSSIEKKAKVARARVDSIKAKMNAAKQEHLIKEAKAKEAKAKESKSKSTGNERALKKRCAESKKKREMSNKHNEQAKKG